MADSGKVLWHGRFEAPPAPKLLQLTSSLRFDIRLLDHDVAATKAHARALLAAGFLSGDEVAQIDEALDDIVADHRAGSLVADGHDEDVHSLLERLLTERLGDVGRRIHAGRSRNDLVATDLRLWCRRQAGVGLELVRELLLRIADLAEEHSGTVMPGVTHLQHAQPVSLGFHLLAHGFAWLRDAERFALAYRAADRSPLGAGALAGTTLPLDVEVATRELGFARVFDNAMDAVSDRDFACDLLYAAALCGVHLSRLAEEIVLWTTPEYGFARLSDEWSTGSSMMPQKRNPDLAELVRGRAAGGIADLTGLLSLLKGLPLAYNRDLQEDKIHLFSGLDRVIGCLQGMYELLGALEFDDRRMAAAAGVGGTWATDLAEALAARGLAFRDAHAAVGALVARLEEDGSELSEVDRTYLAEVHPAFEARDVALADPGRGVQARKSRGGTAPERVLDQVRRLRERTAELTVLPSSEQQ